MRVCISCSLTEPDVKFSRQHRTCNRCRAEKSRTRVAEYQRRRREENPEKIRRYYRDRNRKQREENPHLPFYTTSRYQARKAGAYSDLTKDDAYDIYHSEDVCAYCAKTVSRENSREVHIDHVIPMTQGGPNSRWNLVKTCINCNTSKGPCSLFNFRNRTPEFTQERYNSVIAGMSARSDLSKADVIDLLTQSYEFEVAYERERAKLVAMLSRKIHGKIGA